MTKRGGSRPGAGRKKGVPNKLTMQAKDALAAAFDRVGGVDYLVEIAKTEPKTFCTLLTKLIPNEIKAEIESTNTNIVANMDADKALQAIKDLKGNTE